MPRPYNHPAEDGFSKKIHTVSGVRSLIDSSHLMDLLRELERDGHDVSAPIAELAALVNYVSSSQISLSDVATHLDYCAESIRKSLPQSK